MTTAYEALRALVATRTRRIIVWCGAGLSVDAGLPSWGILQRRLENNLEAKLKLQDDVSAEHAEQRVRSIRTERNPWIAFQRLQNELGVTSFREGIREIFGKASFVEVPAIYKEIWSLQPSGIINLNIDRLATRASDSHKAVIEFKGKEIGKYSYVLDNPRPFICNIHGIEEDSDSWIFTHSSLKNLMDTQAYQQFIAASLMTTTVIFVGITADDIAVGGHLEKLVSNGVMPQVHYWLTNRSDRQTDDWAERNNIRIVPYKVSAGSHTELISMLRDLAGYVQPEEPPSPPVALQLDFGSQGIEPVAELVKRDPEVIRSSLNAHASHLLHEITTDSIAKYEDFSKAYDRAIHAAWYTSTDPKENKFLGLSLLEEKSRGAFGIVFRAIDEAGREFAVKLLHAEIRRKRELLDAFRRGVRSMKILTEKHVPGMVSFVSASEIPATLIMEWIDGPNLNELVETGGLTEWADIVSISKQLADIIALAHSLPERVLHRDIRPPNLMLSNYWDSGEIDLRVLDFDLSWHRGSVEKSVIFGSQLSGYLAPEQVQRKKNVSTQHASVDSYGIGMTIFYMVSQRNPSPGEHAYTTWSTTVGEVVSRPRGAQWKSLPARCARLIMMATREEQTKRWDVIQIRSELNRLHTANLEPTKVSSAELIAEEIAARCPQLGGYEWNDKDFSVHKDFGTGLFVLARGDESRQEVDIELTRTATAAEDRVRLGDLIIRARDVVTRALRDGGWTTTSDVGKGMLTVRASVPVGIAAERVPELADSLRKGIERMVFH